MRTVKAFVTLEAADLIAPESTGYSYAFGMQVRVGNDCYAYVTSDEAAQIAAAWAELAGLLAAALVEAAPPVAEALPGAPSTFYDDRLSP